MVKRYDDKQHLESGKTPEWVRRRHKMIRVGMLNYHMASGLDLLNFCKLKSVQENYTNIVSWLVNSYDLDWDIAEYFAMSTAHPNFEILDTTIQLDPLYFRSDEKAIAFPAEDYSEAYKLNFSVYRQSREHVELRIGRTNTKQDVLWLIDRYWPDVEEVLKIEQPDKIKRPHRGALLRDSLIYSDRVDNPEVSAKEIQEGLDVFFPNDDDVDKATISKIHTKFEPEYDWMEQPREVSEGLESKVYSERNIWEFEKQERERLGLEMTRKLPSFRQFELKFENQEKPHFLFK